MNLPPIREQELFCISGFLTEQTFQNPLNLIRF